LEASDALVAKNDGPAIRSGPAFINAKTKNSQLRKALSADRRQAITGFGIINLSSIHDKNGGGIELLRASRASEIVFRDTHICPVGEECPQEIIEDTGEAMRCGSCRFACKSVDHLPAIEAKRSSLLLRIRSSVDLLKVVNKSGDRRDERKQIHRKIELDTHELLGWTQSAETLQSIFDDVDKADCFLTDEPEIVRKHLKRVVRKSYGQEFLLHRILEADHYPSLVSDDLRLKASRLFRRVLSHSFPEEEELRENPDFEIKALAAAIHARLKMEGVDLSEIASEIESLHEFQGAKADLRQFGGL